jgi:molybdopterin-guanine dinucleotide biosynthesis protein A
VTRGAARAIAGVFVGGAGRRMGGVAKGLLEAPGGRETLLDRWCRLLGEAGVDVVLVGRHPAYASHARAAALEVLDDDPPGVGPLGGLVALLRRAGDGTRGGDGRALAFACDMPFVSEALVARLLAAPQAPAVAPRSGSKWEPLCARYDAGRILPHALRHLAAGKHSLQGVLDDAGAVELPLGPGEAQQLRDWDTPEDRGCPPER